MKRHAGRTPIARTPFRIRATGMELTTAVEERTRQVLRRRLARFGTLIERVDVRFKDVNGPRGGRDTVARIHLLVAGRPPVFVEERALAAGPAIALAAAAVVEAMDRATSKHDMTAPAPTHAPEMPAGRAHAAVRRGREPQRKQAEPPRARPRRRGMVYKLEESATKPSRKSTRKSANRLKGASRLSRRTRRAKHSPRSRASRAQRQRQRSRR